MSGQEGGPAVEQCVEDKALEEYAGKAGWIDEKGNSLLSGEWEEYFRMIRLYRQKSLKSERKRA